MREGRAFSGEKEEVSKSITVWYWPWWKALWMLTSSDQVSQLFYQWKSTYSHLLLLRMDPLWLLGLCLFVLFVHERMRTPYTTPAL